MRSRLAPYLRYYATRRPTDDHPTQPTVLIVFEDELVATHFLRVAEQAMARTDLTLPLLVSDRATLECAGPLGRGWRSVDRHGPAFAF